ncbi:MAG: PAS domain S-box protein [Gammaproteobacteria bacterium]
MTFDPNEEFRTIRAQYATLEARHQATLNATVDGLIIIDECGHIQVFNAAAERIFGYSASDVLGRNVSCLMPSGHREVHDGYIAHYLRTGERKIIGIGREAEGLHKNGTRFPIELAVGEIATSPRQFVGIIRDISWRKEAEALLRARERELRLIIDNAPVGIFTADRDCRIRTANPAFCKLCSRSETELVGSAFADMVAPSERESFAQEHARQLASLSGGEFDVSLVRGDGSLALCSINCGVTIEGTEPLFIAQVVDRTAALAMENEMREQRERLAHVGRLLTMGEMASGIAHEITQPLTAIATYAQAVRRMLAHGRDQDAEVVGAVEQIAKQAERAGAIIRQLRGFMRKEEVRIEAVDINQQLQAVARLAEVDLRHNETRIDLKLAPELPKVMGDAVQIQQVALNLIRNAIDAMHEITPSKRLISLRSMRSPSGEVQFSVSDHGPGVANADRDRLFAPFFTTKIQGMGLGLSISASIVQSFGGRLWYDDAPGGGAMLNVSLPAA